jgi:hypothetical protein
MVLFAKERLLYCDVESKWKYYHIIIFPGQSLSKSRDTHARCFPWRQNNPQVTVSFQKQRYTCEMLPLETKQSGSKLLPHSDLRGGVFLEEIFSSRSHYSKKDYKGKKPIYIYKIYDITVRACDKLYANKLIFRCFS